MKKDDKTKLLEEKVTVIDFYVLKSKTIKILLTSTAVTSLGLNTPVFYLVRYFNYALDVPMRINKTHPDRAGQPRGLEAGAS